jgi:hypothetical protein
MLNKSIVPGSGLIKKADHQAGHGGCETHSPEFGKIAEQ